jgi:hypothetical protein
VIIAFIECPVGRFMRVSVVFLGHTFSRAC